MQVQVIFTTQLKAALGRSQEQISLEPGATVRDAITQLAATHPETFQQLVIRDGRLLPSILLSANDKQIDVTTRLSDGDTLTLLSAISGG